MRSPWRRTNSAGSKPPMTRWPVSRHQPTSVPPARARCRRRSRSGCRREGAARASGRAAPRSARSPREVGGEPVPGVVVERSRRRPVVVGHDGGDEQLRPGLGEDGGAALGGGSRWGRGRARAARAARTRRSGAGRGGRAARGSPAARRADSRSGRAPWRAARAPAISANTRSGGSIRPQPGTSHTPHEMGAPASPGASRAPRSDRGGVGLVPHGIRAL